MMSAHQESRPSHAQQPPRPEDPPPAGRRQWLNAARSPWCPSAAQGAGACALLHLTAAPRRLPRADQPAVVDARAARPGRTGRARDGRGGDDPDQARLGVARPPPRPVPAPGRRGRRRPPLARLLADLRPGPAGRLHRDHAEAACATGTVSPFLCGRRSSRHDRAAGRGRRDLRAARSRCQSGCCSSAQAAASRRSSACCAALERRARAARRRPHPLRAHAGRR